MLLFYNVPDSQIDVVSKSICVILEINLPKGRRMSAAVASKAYFSRCAALTVGLVRIRQTHTYNDINKNACEDDRNNQPN